MTIRDEISTPLEWLLNSEATLRELEEFEPLLVLVELCIANILCLTLCDTLHGPHIFILVSMRSYKLLLRAGPKAGIPTSHSIYPNFELIEIFNKTGGMWDLRAAYIRRVTGGCVVWIVAAWAPQAILRHCDLGTSLITNPVFHINNQHVEHWSFHIDILIFGELWSKTTLPSGRGSPMIRINLPSTAMAQYTSARLKYNIDI